MREYAAVFTIGAAGYGALELLWRGFTHWTMLLTGGFCFLLLYLMDTRLDAPLCLRCFLGALTVTAVEFTVGALVNVLLDWGVWDYSDMSFNLCGQVCLPYSALWLLLCIPVNWLSVALRRRLCRGPQSGIAG